MLTMFRELSVDTGKEEWAQWVCNTLSVDPELKKEEVQRKMSTTGSTINMHVFLRVEGFVMVFSFSFITSRFYPVPSASTQMPGVLLPFLLFASRPIPLQLFVSDRCIMLSIALVDHRRQIFVAILTARQNLDVSRSCSAEEIHLGFLRLSTTGFHYHQALRYLKTRTSRWFFYLLLYKSVL